MTLATHNGELVDGAVVANNKPTYEELVRTLQYIHKTWENSWMRLVIEDTLKGDFEWIKDTNIELEKE